jgi:hypothetical protein
MRHTYTHTESKEAKKKAIELSHDRKIWVLEGATKKMDNTIIEIVDHPIHSTIATGFTLAIYFKGKEISIS